MADNTNSSAVNPYYIAGALAVIAAAGGAYWFFTQKPKSQVDAGLEKQQEANAAAAEKKEAEAKANPSAAKDYSLFATWRGVFPSAPKTAGKRSLGDSVVIRAGVKPRRLNEKLEYVEDGESKHVQVRLGSIWGWAGADHSLVIKGGAAPNIIVKSDDVKIAPFYEVKSGDVVTGDEGVLSKIKDKALSYGDDGGVYVGDDGFNYSVGLPANVFENKAKPSGSKKHPTGTVAVGVMFDNKKQRGLSNYNANGFNDEFLNAKAAVNKRSRIRVQDLTPHNSWTL